MSASQYITTSYTYDAAGNLLSTTRTGTDGSSSVRLSATCYNVLGRPVFQTNALGGVTSTTYGFDPEGRPVVTNTFPDAGTRIDFYNRDGRHYQTIGTAVHPVRYEYGTAWEGYTTQETKLNESGQPTDEWMTQTTDAFGRHRGTAHPNGSSSSIYNTKGQLAKEVDPDGVTTRYGYNNCGEREVVAIDGLKAGSEALIDSAEKPSVTF